RVSVHLLFPSGRGVIRAMPNPILTLGTYQARPGCEEELSGILRTHVARLRELGLIADRPYFAAARADAPERFVESFWWAHEGAALPRGPGDDSIAGAKPVQGEHQAPEEIMLERIHAGLEEEDVGPRPLQHSGEVALQHLNIFRIATAIGQRDVQ